MRGLRQGERSGVTLTEGREGMRRNRRKKTDGMKLAVYSAVVAGCCGFWVVIIGAILYTLGG
jgi:hypothetical protein